MSEITRLLESLEARDPHASSALLPVIYDELRRLARAQMANERSGHTLQATALVHEAYLRLMNDGAQGWKGRRHFFSVAAEAMRRILIEHARRKNSIKRGGQQQRIELDDDLLQIQSPCADVEDLLALDSALDRLAVEHPEKAELIKLLYFAGLSLNEAADALGMSKTTAHRQASFARAWLFDSMERSDG